MKIKNLILVIIIISFSLFANSQNYTISGYVSDNETGEYLIGANIYATKLQKGVQTNSYGFFSLTLPAQDTVEISVSFIGYNPEIRKIFLTENEVINFELQAGILINNVVINANSIDRRNEMGNLEIPVKQLNLIPTIGAESDLMKAFQLMPGVQSGNEGSSGLYVRGGSPDQNLILLDGTGSV